MPTRKHAASSGKSSPHHLEHASSESTHEHHEEKAHNRKVNPRVLFTFLSAVIIVAGTLFAIRYAKGQRPSTEGFRETGLLSANSFPTAAQVFINGKLSTATDDTLNLDPGEYQIEIKKEGFTSWRKNLLVEKELVTQTNALLFPSAPSLSPITFTGVQNILPAPDGQKLIFYTSSASAEPKNGLYLADLTDNPLSLQRGSRQISNDTDKLDLSIAQLIWSPDSTELMVTDGDQYYLLDITKLNNFETLQNITVQAERILSSWEEEMYLRERQILAKFPEEVIQIATSSAANMYFSPDQEKMFYTATASAILAEELIQLPPARNTQPEMRTLLPGNIYVYDRMEDKNFLIGTVGPVLNIHKRLLADDLSQEPASLEVSPDLFTQLQATESAQTAARFRSYHSGLFSGNLQWYPDSRHLIRTQGDHVSIVEFDNTNEVTVYSGPFDPSFVYPWSNGDRLLILTSFNQPAASPKNLYAIGLK